jgi:DNA-binding MarR family transcriptional regulator
VTHRAGGDAPAALDEEISDAAARLQALIRRRQGSGSGLRGPAVDDGTEEFARRLLALRRLRETMLGGEFFSDPAWDMLLDLYAQRRRLRPASISTLCFAAGVPGTTALRCLNGLVAAGLLVRRTDPQDGRRALISFAPGAEESMRLLLARAMAELQRPPETA